MATAKDHSVPTASRTAGGAFAAGQTGAEPLPATDTLWREVYHVIAPLPGDAGVQRWRAHRTDTAQEVVLRVAPGTKDDSRSAALTRLSAVDLAHLQRVREGCFIGAQRVEICDAVRGVPLDEWRRGHASVEVATVEAVVRQIAEALGVLHATGLVHLGLRPGAILVREEKDGLHCTLGGLESVAFFEAGQPIIAAVDPLYAPPEAAALERHEAGPTLCAWDWWSLGRVAQELILGHHVMQDLPAADAAQSPEALLLEGTAKGPRAGAVETMAGLPPRLDLLLRGLLASAPEARWKGDAVDRWVKQLPVEEHYLTPRTEKKFRWRGRLWAVADAAKELQTAEHWTEATTQVFDAAIPGTLANFIRRAPDQKAAATQLAEVLKLAEGEPLAGLPPAVARELLAALGLLALSGGTLMWRGRRLDGESLGALLAEAPDSAERLALVRALTHRTVTSQIDRTDFAAGRALAQVSRSAADAESIIRRNGWLKGGDEMATTRIFRLMLEPEAALLATRTRLQRDFACSSQPSVEKIFKVAKAARVELVVLAWVEPTAAQNGFVTHVDWEAQQLKLLQARCVPFVLGLNWAQLGRALAAGPALFGAWPAVLVIWLIVAAIVALIFPGPKWGALALAPAVFAIGARLALARWPAAAVRKFAAGARPWKWTEGVRRCETETAAAAHGLDAAGLTRSLAEINAEIAKLTRLAPPPAPVGAPAPFASIRGAAMGSWILLGVIAVGCGVRAKFHPPSVRAVELAWFPSLAAPVPVSAAAKEAEAKFAAKAASAEKAAAGNDIKVSWPYHETDDFETLTAIETAEPTKAQLAYALQRGQAIAAPYRGETINSLVLFEVPAGEKIGVVVFDCAHAGLAVPRVFFLEFRPPARAWVELAGKKAVVVPE